MRSAKDNQRRKSLPGESCSQILGLLDSTRLSVPHVSIAASLCPSPRPFPIQGSITCAVNQGQAQASASILAAAFAAGAAFAAVERATGGWGLEADEHKAAYPGGGCRRPEGARPLLRFWVREWRVGIAAENGLAGSEGREDDGVGKRRTGASARTPMREQR
ncbi:hypothetical protein GQ55_2G411900 [Panicum hallii var. hallii]|uniref:Uncharacterized protein n=2 Tax=Panicum hallii TaxID=206008 RepID=A0A2T7EXT8_9POAL|nr:hypothetical protein PAHAL_2G425500 [Panicum hallii]PUZ72657.1 hypothetical protein GQ55_2G411900 [Panicum hallii var. hallii]